MPTSTQELTLFGGWATGQIQKVTDYGVWKTSATFSASSRIFKPSFTATHHVRRLKYGDSQQVINLEPIRYGDGYSYQPTLFIGPSNWTHRAFVRYFQIWGNGDMPRMMRGLKGTKALGRSFAGLLGVNNDKIPNSIGKAMHKRPDGIWECVNLDNLYPEVKRLDATGIASARRFAKEQKAIREAGI
jgi:hypothetical protein